MALTRPLFAVPFVLAVLGMSACECCRVPNSSGCGDESTIDLPDSSPAKHGHKGGGHATAQAMYLPTGEKSTSSLAVRCAMPREVIAGQNFDYAIEVCNLTSVTLANVQVTYKLDGARVVSTDPDLRGGAFALGDLMPHACKTITVTAAAAGVGAAKTCLGATWTNAVCSATNVVQPALKLTLDSNTRETTPCNAIVYTVTISNPGTGSATNVRVADDLPAGLASEGKSNLTWDIGTLKPGAAQTRQFVASVARTGSYTNRVQGGADGNLSATSNDVTVAVKAPSLRLSVLCPQKVYIGRNVQYKIGVANRGDAPAVSTRVEDYIPSGLTFVSASDGGTSSNGGKVTWSLGTLDPGASREITLTCTTRLLGKVENKVWAGADCAEPATSACTTSYDGTPDIGTGIYDDDGVVLVGDIHVFHYSVRNQGQIDLTNVVVNAELDPGLELQSSTFEGEKTASGNRVTWKLGTLKAGQQVKFDIVCTGSKPGELLIHTSVSSDQSRPIRKDESVNYVER